MYVFKIIYLKIINYYYNDLLTGHFGIKIIRGLVAKKYFWPISLEDIEVYIKGCDVYLTLKVVCHKLYKNI